MATTSFPSVSFDETDTRHDEMYRTIEQWFADLAADVDDARASEQSQAWLDVQSEFHDYPHRNTLLITLQCPEVTKVAGYRMWQAEFDRYVEEGELAIWIWVPIVTIQCPECRNTPSYHENSECEYDETPPEEWSEGLVGFKPAPVSDISQTKGEPLPELDTVATGESDTLAEDFTNIASDLGVTIRTVDPDEWRHGEAKGACQSRSVQDLTPLVKVKDRSNRADFASTIIHEYAHAVLYFDTTDATERAKREVEAEAVVYVVGRYLGLDASGSTFYLAAWQGDKTNVLQERLGRISGTVEEILSTLDAV